MTDAATTRTSIAPGSAVLNLGRAEVSNAEYRTFAPDHSGTPASGMAHPSCTKENASYPVVQVGRGAARAFCASVGGALPTRREWLAALRATGESARLVAAVSDGPEASTWRTWNLFDRSAATFFPNVVSLTPFSCNDDEPVVRRTLGRQAGASESAFAELIGNVAEWIETDTNDEPDEPSVIGGSWRTSRDVASSAVHTFEEFVDEETALRGRGDIGFRVLLRLSR